MERAYKSILFKDFSTKDFDEIRDRLELREFKKNSQIFRQGDTPVSMFILLSGGVQIEKVDLNGKRTIVNIFKDQGTVFGEVYLYINQPYDYSCLALDDSQVLEIGKDLFIEESVSPVQKKLTRNMLEVLSKKAFHLNQKLLILSSFTLRQKITNYLLQFSKESGEVHLAFNREELADYMGTTRPSLSRELKNMEDDGLIKIDRGVIHIENLERLIEIS